MYGSLISLYMSLCRFLPLLKLLNAMEMQRQKWLCTRFVSIFQIENAKGQTVNCTKLPYYATHESFSQNKIIPDERWERNGTRKSEVQRGDNRKVKAISKKMQCCNVSNEIGRNELVFETYIYFGGMPANVCTQRTLSLSLSLPHTHTHSLTTFKRLPN